MKPMHKSEGGQALVIDRPGIVGLLGLTGLADISSNGNAGVAITYNGSDNRSKAANPTLQLLR